MINKRLFCTVLRSAPLLALGALIASLTAQEKAPYILGADDQITVQALHVPDITDKPIRIDKSGYISLPLAGRMRAEGLSVEDLEKAIRDRLDPYVRDPQVSVSVVEHRSQPVSVAGAVNNPGVFQLQGSKKLLELLSMAGGARPDAADTLHITRQLPCVPSPETAHKDATGKFLLFEVSLRQLMEAGDPATNVTICAQDVITLPRARLVYVLGEVRKPGGFPLRDEERATVLQAISMAEGVLRTASYNHVRILRLQSDGTKRLEVPVNLKAIMAAKSSDIAMEPGDILLVPNSVTKVALMRSAEAAIQAGTGIVIWGRY